MLNNAIQMSMILLNKLMPETVFLNRAAVNPSVSTLVVSKERNENPNPIGYSFMSKCATENHIADIITKIIEIENAIPIRLCQMLPFFRITGNQNNIKLAKPAKM